MTEDSRLGAGLMDGTLNVAARVSLLDQSLIDYRAMGADLDYGYLMPTTMRATLPS